MNNLQIFSNNEFGEIRTVEIDGNPYFVANDVANALGYSNPRKAIIDHCKGVTKRDTPTSSGVQSMSYINEGDLYRLIMKSKLPSAEKFEKWVMEDILPSIRKNGGYIVGQETLSDDELLSKACRNNRIDIPKCAECEYRHLVTDQYKKPGIYICTKIWVRINSGCKSSPMNCPKRDSERDCEERGSR